MHITFAFSSYSFQELSPFPWQILLGLRDSNDELVAMTLHAVADLVPILGGDIVIGAKRNRLFNEGRPKVSLKPLNDGLLILVLVP
jgi:hypothetical protein